MKFIKKTVIAMAANSLRNWFELSEIRTRIDLQNNEKNKKTIEYKIIVACESFEKFMCELYLSIHKKIK